MPVSPDVLSGNRSGRATADIVAVTVFGALFMYVGTCLLLGHEVPRSVFFFLGQGTLIVVLGLWLAHRLRTRWLDVIWAASHVAAVVLAVTGWGA